MSADLEAMAREAGFRVFGAKIVAADEGSSGLATASLERFAALVRAAALEEAAQHCAPWGRVAEAIRALAAKPQ